MSFCVYCGKQLADGEACNCKESVEVRIAVAATEEVTTPNLQEMSHLTQNGQTEPVQSQQIQQTAQAVSQTVSQTAEKISQKVNEAMNSKTAAKVQGVLGELKDLIISFFKKPETALQVAYQSPRKDAQYVAGGIYAAVLFIFMWLLLKVFDGAWKYALGITAVWCLMKLILIGATMASKKDGRKFADVAGVFCVSTIPQTTAFLAFFLLVKIGFPAGAVAMLVIWIAVDIIYSVEAMKAVMSTVPEKAVRVYLIVEAVMVLIMYFIFSQIVQSMIQDMMSSVMGGLSGLSSLFY